VEAEGPDFVVFPGGMEQGECDGDDREEWIEWVPGDEVFGF